MSADGVFEILREAFMIAFCALLTLALLAGFALALLTFASGRASSSCPSAYSPARNILPHAGRAFVRFDPVSKTPFLSGETHDA
ncbi:hypothetical protein MPC4_170009 [Methylocella tundrae]|uniref:Uncharacterized protein n=1 Tax=Methylocella tundrae TaxID=227605 RepID=A0A8B6M542_METTU|nr:hypothetical protein [Methylocella tundrae]VTZ23110.1 hypothetical protein MPC1_13650002 [Methylocella tundrae]VTZ49479.1 hypothetical protein MPC4_170009 [Methylocella tundrae]